MAHYHRCQREEDIQQLADRYPQTFFKNGGLRLPLKRGIVNDLIDDGAFDKERLLQALDYYERDFSYLHAMLVGAERYDLNGKVSGKVTLAEQEAARRYIAQRKIDLANEREAKTRSPVGSPAPKRGGAPLPPAPTPVQAAPTPPAPPSSAASEGTARALQLLTELTAALDCIRPVLGDNSFAPLRKVLVGAALKDVAAKVEALATEVAS